MKRWKKYSLRAVGFLVAIIIVIGVLLTVMVNKSLPDYGQVVTVSSQQVANTVDVYRDKWGVTHIYAQDNYSLFFAQGYVQAQDRLFQMELNRLTGKGELSRYFGSNLLGSDIYMRTMGLKRAAEQSISQLDQETLELINAYVDGVNHYIDTNKDNLSVEFKMLGVTPEPWSPVDVATTANIMVLYMSYNYLFETMRAEMIARFNEDMVNDLFMYDEGDEIIVPEEVNDYKGLVTEAQPLQIGLYQNYINRWGSNNWVVNGELTKNKKPILANDTHTDLALPSTWYEMGLHSPEYKVSGYSLIGVPWIVIGHNEKIAWGITNGTTDVQDMYLEKVDNVENPTKYYFKEQWHDIKAVKETFEIRGEEPIEKTIYMTNHGPLVNEAMDYDLSQPISLRWTLWEGNTMFDAIRKVNQASNWNEFRGALKHWNNAAQNFVYADVEGNIGYQNTSKAPIRVEGHQGRVPVPGWTGEYEWQGYVPYEELPSIYNPEEGFIATANNKIMTDDGSFISDDWCKDYRVDRIKALLQDKNNLTIEDMQTIQRDNYSVIAEALVPYITHIETDDPLVKDLIERLENWDYNMTAQSEEALLFEVWYNQLIKNVLNDKLGYTRDDIYQPRNRFMDYSDNHYAFMINIMEDKDNQWFDDMDTEKIEDRDATILTTLKDTLDYFKVNKSKDLDNMTWGDLHTVTLKNMAFGEIGIDVIENLFNSQAYPTDGSLSTINVGSYGWDSGFDIDFGTSQRFIVDMSDFDITSTINSTGQSEHLFHKNRFDQTELWAEGGYKTSYFSEDKIKETAVHTMVITFEENN